MHKTRTALAAAAVALLLALSACGPGQGPAGTVVDKDRTYWAATKQWTFKLTTRDKAGTEHTFRVSNGDYSACYRGSAYPRCTEGR